MNMIENVKYIEINRMVFGELEEVTDIHVCDDYIQFCRTVSDTEESVFTPVKALFLNGETRFITTYGKSYALVKSISEDKPILHCHEIAPTCSDVVSVHNGVGESVLDSASLSDWLNNGFVVKLTDADFVSCLLNGHTTSATHINSICGVRDVGGDAKQGEQESEFYRERIDGCDIYLHEDKVRNILSYFVVHESLRNDDKKLAVFGYVKGPQTLNVTMTRGANVIDIANVFGIKEATFAFASLILPNNIFPYSQYIIGRYSYPVDADRILVRDPWKNIVHEFTAEYVRKTYRAFDIHVKYFDTNTVPSGTIAASTYLAKDNRWTRAATSMNVTANASADVLITNAVAYLNSYVVTRAGCGGGRVYGNSQNANGAAASAFYPPIAPDVFARPAPIPGQFRFGVTPDLKPIAGMAGGPLGGYGPYHPHNEMAKPVEKSMSRNRKEVYTAFDTRADLINMEAVVRLEFTPNPEDRNTVVATSSDSTIGMQRIIPFDYYTAIAQYEEVFGVNSIEELAPDAAHPSSCAVEVESASVRSGEVTYTFRMRSDDRNRVDIFTSNEQPPTDHIGSISTALFNAMLRAQCIPTTNTSAAMCVIEMIKK